MATRRFTQDMVFSISLIYYITSIIIYYIYYTVDTLLYCILYILYFKHYSTEIDKINTYK